MKLLCVLTVAAVLASFHQGAAQNIQTSTIEWSCNSTFAAHPGIITDEITRVVSSPESITWYDNAGTARQTLSIGTTNGSWNNVSHNGSMLFVVNSGNSRGVVQFRKSGGVTLIQIQIIGETESQTYELTVTDVNTL